ncbi:MAG TPA: hypothetical protein VJ694_02085 [Patescibacteria group bacterium]|nr:hypothetical protein [Patescibacteria group bacterium]
MRAALIVVGTELRSTEEAETLSDYLRRVAGLRYVALCEASKRSQSSLKCAFFNHATRAGRQPFLLAYIGHGYKDRCDGKTGWSYGVEHGDKDLRLPYETLLTWLIESRDGPTLFLNDCCYAESFLTPEIRENPRLQIGLIASSVAEGYSYGDLTQSIIDTWMDGKPYVPRTYPGTLQRCLVQEARFGPELDTHFFPDPRKRKTFEREAALNEMPA